MACGSDTCRQDLRTAREVERVTPATNGSRAIKATQVVENGPDTRPNFPHLIHLILTIFTAGMWSVIWVAHYLCRGETYRA